MAETTRRLRGHAQGRVEIDDDLQYADEQEENEDGGRAGLWLALLALVVFGVFGAVVWFAYSDGVATTMNEEPEVIRADIAAFKREPVDAAGGTVSDAGADVAGLLDDARTVERTETIAPDEPIAVVEGRIQTPEGEPSLADASSSIQSLEATLEQAGAIAPARSERAETSAAAEAGQIAGSAASTSGAAAALPDGSADIASSSIEASGVSITRGAPSDDGSQRGYSRAPAERVEPANGDPRVGSGVLPGGAFSTLPERRVEQTAPTEREVAALSSEPPSSSRSATREPRAELGGDALYAAHRLQLLASSDEDAARAAWDELRGRYPSVLGELASVFQRADTDNGVFYRLQVGPFGSRDAASAACDRLKSLGGDCFVAAPSL